ncbi:MAG: BACON domain-containing carbohydrate-binding protein [Pyrinomonadaceae bacterium]
MKKLVNSRHQESKGPNGAGKGSRFAYLALRGFGVSLLLTILTIGFSGLAVVSSKSKNAENGVNPKTALFVKSVNTSKRSSLLGSTQTNLVPPTGSVNFGTDVKFLANGNIVVTDPGFAFGSLANVGAVHLYDGSTFALISTIRGSNANDRVGSGGVKPLSNGKFVITSPNWRNPATSVVLAGAVTLCDGTSGCTGVVTSSNSLVGSTADDLAGLGGIYELPSGDYVVSSYRWDNTSASAEDAGAVTFCSGTSGCTGAISGANSLIGQTTSDVVGSGYLIGQNPITVLAGGDYVVRSPFWTNPSGGVSAVGAVTKCSGTTGCAGNVSSANSLVGTTDSDAAGIGGVTALPSGGYVVNSNRWDNPAGPVVDAGAVTYCASGGCTGEIVSGATLFGTTDGDLIGGNGVTLLSNGNYVVVSNLWDNIAVTAPDAGAVTWCDGTSGCSGAVTTTNSFVGSQNDDEVGLDGVTALTNGNFVIASHLWDLPGAVATDVGAVTWCDGASACVGSPSASNSLVGNINDDRVGVGAVQALDGGNYVVSSYDWDNSSSSLENVGAVTFCSSSTGCTGAVTAANSLTGSTSFDQVGGGGVVPLAGGAYVVGSSGWDEPTTGKSNVGAATFCPASTGCTGVVSSSNSLIGTTASDTVGNRISALPNGDYVVVSSSWNDAVNSRSFAGAVTKCDGGGGCTGPVGSSNSLIGGAFGDFLGLGGITPLSSSDYILSSPFVDNPSGPVEDAGAITYGFASGGPVGTVSSANSILGGFSFGTFSVDDDDVSGNIAVGKAFENVVTIFSPEAPAQNCAYFLGNGFFEMTAAGGSDSVTVTVDAGCGWTATSNDSWIIVDSGSSGSGVGTVGFTVAQNLGPVRTGTITIAGKDITITQAGGCSYSISPTSTTSGASGSSGTVSVTTDPGCAWQATSNDGWISVTSGSSGSGNGTVGYTVGANTGPARSGTITIAGNTFTVNQDNGCSYSLSHTSISVGAGGGGGSFDVVANSGCVWSSFPNAGWISITGGSSGSGNGTVSFTVAANTGPARTSTISVAGLSFTVNQSSGCEYSIDPTSATAPSGGTTGAVGVTANTGCEWTATSNDAWISVTSGSSGSGNGTVGYTVAANTGPARTGTVTIAGQTFTVNQSSGCAYSIDPTSTSAPPAGASGTVAVTTDTGCDWTATSNDSWISVTSGSKGSGNGTVGYTVAANTGPARTGTVTIAGQTFTVNQSSGCAYSIDPTSTSAPPAGASGSVAVTTETGCDWTATSNDSWISVTSGSTGSGNGTVGYTVAANTGPARTGTVTIAGQTFTVNQTSGCSYSINPTSATSPSTGTTGTVAVTTDTGCDWTATSNDSWITVTSGSTGSGNGTVGYTVAANTGAARSGTITIAGESFTVNQDGASTNAFTRFDFDGDQKADVSIFRPGPGEWWYLRSSDNGNNAFQFGSSTDIIVPQDFTGDGRSDSAFWRPSTGEWYVLRSEDSTFFAFPFGTTGDIPAPGDFDGDGKADAAVFRPSSGFWFIFRSSDAQVSVIPFGSNGDRPLVGDYDNDGIDDVGIYRPSAHQFWLNRSTAGVIVYQFGADGDEIFADDFTGDGTADVGFFRPSTGEWFVLRNDNQTFFAFPFGTSGDISAPGDYDGDGVADAAVFRPSGTVWFINQSTAGVSVIPFGAAGDQPLPGAYMLR